MALKRMGPVELTEEQSAQFEAQVEQADRDADPETGTQMIAMRWGRPQLRAVKRAAELRGLPYQLYIRNAAWEAAVRDLEKESLLPSR